MRTFRFNKYVMREREKNLFPCTKNSNSFSRTLYSSLSPVCSSSSSCCVLISVHHVLSLHCLRLPCLCCYPVWQTVCLLSFLRLSICLNISVYLNFFLSIFCGYASFVFGWAHRLQTLLSEKMGKLLLIFVCQENSIFQFGLWTWFT